MYLLQNKQQSGQHKKLGQNNDSNKLSHDTTRLNYLAGRTNQALIPIVTPRFPNNVNNISNQSIQRKTECHTTFKT